MAGGMCGWGHAWGVCVARGSFMPGGHVWPGGYMPRGWRVWPGGACMAGGCAWQGGICARDCAWLGGVCAWGFVARGPCLAGGHAGHAHPPS